MATQVIATRGGPHKRDMWNSLKGEGIERDEVKFMPVEGHLNPRDEHSLICVMTKIERVGESGKQWSIRALIVRDPFKDKYLTGTYNSSTRTGAFTIEEV